MRCNTNLNSLTRLGTNITSPNRYGVDYSYFNGTSGGYAEIYRLRSKSTPKLVS